MADFQNERELLGLLSQLPNYPDSIQSAYLLGQLALICHRLLAATYIGDGPSFWTDLSPTKADRLRGFLLDARDGLQNAVDDLWHHAGGADRASAGEVA